MIGVIESVLVLLVEFIFGVLAIVTQLAALNSPNIYSTIVHGIAWAVEVIIAVGAFFVLALFSSPTFAVVGFIIGIMILITGTKILISKVKS